MLPEMSESVSIYSAMSFLDCMAQDAEAPVCPVNLQEVVSQTVLVTVWSIIEVLTQRGHIQCPKTFAWAHSVELLTLLWWIRKKSTCWVWSSTGYLRAIPGLFPLTVELPYLLSINGCQSCKQLYFGTAQGSFYAQLVDGTAFCGDPADICAGYIHLCW